MKKHLWNAVRWLITIGIFWYLFAFKIDEKKFLETVRDADWGWIVAAVVIFPVTLWCGFFRWHLLLKTQEIVLPLRRILAIGLVGHFFNSFLLGATGGDVIKAYYVSRQTHTHKAEAVMSVFVDRIVGLIGLCVIGVITMVINFRLVAELPNLRAAALFVIAIIVAGCVLVPLTLWRGMFQRVPLLGRLREKLARRPAISRALDSYQSYAGHKRTLVPALLLSLCVHTGLIVIVIFLSRALGIEGVSAGQFFLVVPLVNTIAAIPITPSGFGLREGMYVKLLGDLGVGGEPAIALSLLTYGVQLVWSLVGGLVYMFWKHEPHMLQHAREDLA